jgi:exonuclease SbcC
MDEFNLQLRQLISLEPGKECPICLSNIQDLDEVIIKRENRKIELIRQVETERQGLEQLETHINEENCAIQQANEACIEMERTELIIAKFIANVSEYHKGNIGAQKELAEFVKIEHACKNEKSEIYNLLKLPSLQQNLNDIECQKSKLEEQIKELGRNLIECGIIQGNMRGYLDELERRESEKQVLLEEDKKLSHLSETYKKLAKAFGKDGIQAIIMENVTEDLKDYTNSVLKQICDEQMSVNFITQKQTGTGNWKEDFDIQIITKDSIEDFDDISGGEQVRVAIALRLALSQLLMNRIGRNIQFLLLDEVDRDLDRQGIEALADVIRKLSKRFKILVITHNEFMKEKFEYILIVQKGTDGSVLKQ